MLSFLAIGRTVRRVEDLRRGLRGERIAALHLEAVRPADLRIATLPMPTAVALIGRLTPERCLPASRTVCAACPTCSGPSVCTLIA